MEVEEFLCAKALLEEVGTTRKPGLVDRIHSGGHTDMDYQTFVASTRALKPFFGEMAETGKNWEGSLPALFKKIRLIGQVAELAMFQATGGVNTHKGLLFSAGILCSISGYSRMKYGSTNTDLLCSLVQEMTFEVLEEEFFQILEKPQKTHGEQLFTTKGIRGIRGEVQQGFPSVLTVSLPVYTRLLKEGRDSNLARIQTLLHLMANVCDTNILYRHSQETLDYVQQTAHYILQRGGAFSEEGLSLIVDFDRICTEKKISAGGCADLLGVTILLHDLNLLDAYGSTPSALLQFFRILTSTSNKECSLHESPVFF
ncbi:triphosphoribosyl-dephospho-CoA synthase CitG [Sphaerochaeta pleomorpha str. Grapes]|uniref:triphosphoribosyl-dephospho-CoA synthase n=1 Tax=Sphaerochaeta pleomorpha (strain ATCC BAA-1885 / DSM 22778 / Grapes) TaxID=158190 RepID=G8QUL7_SPHPG|nr:triphosphoribosyl-dephospho-CoA synthase CitG [Sphaerochaeta pleomorpha]AEV30325.1 triphosphoribosyl-dephospho-CoA synthase CitG [Sphaerochaeta pleomorpha str. Grapes]